MFCFLQMTLIILWFLTTVCCISNTRVRTFNLYTIKLNLDWQLCFWRLWSLLRSPPQGNQASHQASTLVGVVSFQAGLSGCWLEPTLLVFGHFPFINSALNSVKPFAAIKNLHLGMLTSKMHKIPPRIVEVIYSFEYSHFLLQGGS